MKIKERVFLSLVVALSFLPCMLILLVRFLKKKLERESTKHEHQFAFPRSFCRRYFVYTCQDREIAMECACGAKEKQFIRVEDLIRKEYKI
jgi:multidrug efflux pump subunit AcrB